MSQPFSLPASLMPAEGEIVRIEDTPMGPLALANVAGTLRATSDRCPHGATFLSEGFVEGEWLICPTHFAEFNLFTGEVKNGPVGCPAITCFDVEVEDERLLVHSPRQP